MNNSEKMLNQWFVGRLSCPDCGQRLIVHEEIMCSACAYQTSLASPVEIKPKRPSTVKLKLQRLVAEHPAELLAEIPTDPPKVMYTGPAAVRDSRELMSEIAAYLTSGSAVLDLGCGPRDQAAPIEFLGHQYVGVDYLNEKADFLADAHAIPFQSATFECVLSYAVLEHLHNPFIAIQEIDRVLKPGGIYIGTVSQGEPFHESYFHHTPWGFLSLVSSVPSFRVERLWSSGDTLGSLSRIGRYPKIIRTLIKMVDEVRSLFPWLAPRKMKWSHKEKMLDELYRAGSVCFVVKKVSE